jgi:hypothetical protein
VTLRVTGADGASRQVAVTLGERPGSAGEAGSGCAG